MKAKVLVSTFVIGLLLMPGFAGAHLVGHGDPNDVRGPIDIRRASVDRDGRQITARIRTYERFTKRDLLGGAFFVDFDSRRDGRRDFSLRMDFYEGAFAYCTLYDRQGFSRFGTYGEKGARSFSCIFPRGELQITDHIRWRSRSEGSYETDYAPGRGWYRH